MVKSVIGDVTTYYAGSTYEKKVVGSEQVERKYYFAGSSRIAMRENGTITWLLSDNLGSTSTTAAADGSLLDSVKYTAFGEIRDGTTATDYRYTGQRDEFEIGLYYYVARYYDPVVGRFISADTIVPQPGSSQAYDRYAYTNNNPINFNDPSGNYACADFDDNGKCIPEIKSKVAGPLPSSPVTSNNTPTATNGVNTPVPYLGLNSFPFSKDINAWPTITPSPTSSYGNLSGSGSLNDYFAMGTFFEEGHAGARGYGIKYEARFGLTEQGSNWLLTIFENYEIYPVSIYSAESITSTQLVFDLANGDQQVLPLGELDIDQNSRAGSYLIQFPEGYPINVTMLIYASIEETYMLNPKIGQSIKYDFTSLSWR